MNNISAIKKYKNSVVRKYIFLSSQEVGSIEKGNWLVSQKIDGQLWFYVKEGNVSKIMNANESDITSQIKNIIKELDQNFKSYKKVILAGELYYATTGRERYGDVIAGLGDSAKGKNLRYGIFDIVSMDKAPAQYEDKYKLICKLAGKTSTKLSHAIPQDSIGHKDIPSYFKEHIEKKGLEGLIVRNDSIIYKVKSEETADLLVTGYTMGSQPGQVRSVSLGFYLNEKEIIHVGSCGSFENDSVRKDLYKQLSSIKVEANFKKIASNGSAYIFVKPKVVVEVQLLELQGDKSNDQPIRHLKYEYDQNKLMATGRARSVSILNSKVIAIRKDKQANLQDCGLGQIIKISGIPKSEFKEITLKDLPKSKIIKKEIYVKDSNKGKAVKKFIFWKSNKEKTGDYPSYLCYYLDFSDGRQDPIKRKLYPFEDEKEGLQLFKSLLEENIKKGWEKYSGA